jgi:hypothetical protein
MVWSFVSSSDSHCFLFYRLDQVVIHVGALSLKESQELVCMLFHLGETAQGTSIFMLKLVSVLYLVCGGCYAR